MPARPTHTPAVGDPVRLMYLAGPERGVVVAVDDGGRTVTVAGEDGVTKVFRLRLASGLYVDDRWTRLAFDVSVADVRARVGLAVALRAAVPVEAQGGGVVAELVAARAHRRLDDVLDGLARVVVAAGGEDARGCRRWRRRARARRR